LRILIPHRQQAPSVLTLRNFYYFINNKGKARAEPLAKPLKTNLSLSNYENKDSAKARVHAENEKTS